MRLLLPFVALLLGFQPSAISDPTAGDEKRALRLISILENERRLEAEPDLKLVDYFQSDSQEVRLRAILAAARIGNPDVLESLQPLGRDQQVSIRVAVAFALGQIKSKKGMAVAVPLLKDADLEVRRATIEAIGRMGGVESSRWIIPFLSDEQISIREQASLALALIKDKFTIPELIRLTERNDAAQWSYVYALYRLADERSIPALHRVLANPVPSPSTGDPSSLLFALKALWSMKKPLTSEEVSLLLQHEDARVQQNALDVVAASGDKSACSTIHKTYRSMNAHSKWKALDAMGVLDCVATERPEQPNVLGAWISAKAKSGKEKELTLLQEAAKHPNWIVRWHTAQALADLPAESTIPVLKALSGDSDSAVRLAALDSLSKYMPQTADLFVPLLENKDFAVRATAVDALGKTKDPKYFPMLIKSFELSQNPAEAEGRVALLDVLADYNSSESLAIFEKALFDPEYTIRRHAIDGLKKLVGSSYIRKGQVTDPEDFLHLRDEVTLETLNRYPAEFGAAESYLVRMKLDKGVVTIRILNEDAPLHAGNFIKLAKRNFYNGLRIHRVVPNFVIQGGDPRGDGWGGAGEILHDQINMRVYKRGMVGMPIAGKDTGGSQFFITHSRQPHLDGNYTIFGEVVSGMEIVDRTEVGDRIVSTEVSQESIAN